MCRAANVPPEANKCISSFPSTPHLSFSLLKFFFMTLFATAMWVLSSVLWPFCLLVPLPAEKAFCKTLWISRHNCAPTTAISVQWRQKETMKSLLKVMLWLIQMGICSTVWQVLDCFALFFWQSCDTIASLDQFAPEHPYLINKPLPDNGKLNTQTDEAA